MLNMSTVLGRNYAKLCMPKLPERHVLTDKIKLPNCLHQVTKSEPLLNNNSAYEANFMISFGQSA